MTHWTAGYVADIDYTYGYYAELNPLRVRLAFLNAGLVPPEIGHACELGFGQGLSANAHAAASVVSWVGTDFNPSQAGFAQELSRISGSGALLLDEAFDAFCHRTDLPDFDYIGLHGIWSWISDENRDVIVDFIRRKLKVGGVLYVSYNTQPGWAAMVPMRDLLTEHAEVWGADGAGISQRIDAALAFADQLLATAPAFAKVNPQIADRIAKIKTQDRHYIAHEYFNRDWRPMGFAQMHRWLQSAKLSWACSANYLEAIDSVNLTAEQQSLLHSIPDSTFRQSTRDFCVNQQFRKDYWVKGPRTLSALERLEALYEVQVILAKPRTEISLTINGSLGEAVLQADVYVPVLDLLAALKPMSLKEIQGGLERLNGISIPFGQVLEAVMVLSSNGTVMPVQPETTIQACRHQTAKLNTHLMNKARGSNDLNYLASPVTGGAITVTRFKQLFLLARQEGQLQPQDWAKFAWNILAAQGQRLVKQGQALQSDHDNLAELTEQAIRFSDEQLPVLIALQIA